MNIGIFDSGIGGLSIARKYLSNPIVNIIYIADTANMPYGVKNPEHICRISSTIVHFLEQYNVDYIVVACHTASILAGKKIKQIYKYIPIITLQESIIEHALAATKNNSIGLIATPSTIQSYFYQQAFLGYNKKIRIIQQACPTLASSIEQYFDKSDILERIIDTYLYRMLITEIDTLILGCTHYSLIKNIIQSYIPGVTLISSDEILNEQLNTKYNVFNTAKQNKHRFFVSGSQETFQKKLEFFLNFWDIKNICYTVETTPWNII